MSILQLYDSPGFLGKDVTIDQDNPDLTSVDFLKKARSLKVLGDPWIVYSETNYAQDGEFKIFRDGDYSSLSSWDQIICSVRHVEGSLKDPRITLFEHANYEGKSVTLHEAEDCLKKYGFHDKASSHTVASGVWILYSNEHFKGDKMIASAGEKIIDYFKIGWKNKVGSLKPVQAKENAEELDEN